VAVYRSDPDVRLSRRSALAGVGSAAIAAATPRAFANPMRVRRNIAALNAQSPDLQSLARAMRIMQSKPAQAVDSWAAFAITHDAVMQRVHNSHHFLPWHKGYLWHFERVVSALSGNPNFALPYWDIADAALAGTPQRMPEILFREPFNLTGVRFAGGGMERAPRDNRNWTDVYRNGLGRGFSGIAYQNQSWAVFGGTALGPGTLERGLHNYLHREIGGRMDQRVSPLDVLFWLHHANMDRIWSSWFRDWRPADYPSALRADPTNIPFLRGSGAASYNVNRWLDCQIGSYGYRYDAYYERPSASILLDAADTSVIEDVVFAPAARLPAAQPLALTFPLSEAVVAALKSSPTEVSCELILSFRERAGTPAGFSVFAKTGAEPQGLDRYVPAPMAAPEAALAEALRLRPRHAAHEHQIRLAIDASDALRATRANSFTVELQAELYGPGAAEEIAFATSILKFQIAQEKGRATR
jgi:hypothetical protein